jgi:hypothetical protein
VKNKQYEVYSIKFGPERGLFRGRVQYSQDSFQLTRPYESMEKAEELCQKLLAAAKKGELL